MPFEKGRGTRAQPRGEHPLSYMTPEKRWQSAISILAAMLGNSIENKKSPGQQGASKAEPRRRAPKPIRLHVQYEDFDGRVWHEHESVYPEPGAD